MNPTHTGSLPGGKRLHLTDATGWSACSRMTTSEVAPIEQYGYKWDDPWCGTCLARLADHAASVLTQFGLEGSKRQDTGKRKTAYRWDATACCDIGTMIRSYIKANPAPVGSKCADDFKDWAKRLRRSGTHILNGLDDMDGGDA